MATSLARFALALIAFPFAALAQATPWPDRAIADLQASHDRILADHPRPRARPRLRRAAGGRAGRSSTLAGEIDDVGR